MRLSDDDPFEILSPDEFTRNAQRIAAITDCLYAIEEYHAERDTTNRVYAIEWDQFAEEMKKEKTSQRV